MAALNTVYDGNNESVNINKLTTSVFPKGGSAEPQGLKKDVGRKMKRKKIFFKCKKK